MRFLCWILVMTSCVRVNAQVDIPELDRMIKYKEVESLDITFQQIPNAGEFISKFNLSEIEQGMIGYWTENYTVKLSQTGTGVKILGVNIYPNRIMEVIIERFGSEQKKRSVLFSLWKIEDSSISVRPVMILNQSFDKSLFNVESVIYLNSQEYFPIGRIKYFEKAYVLREQFDFSTVNSVLKTMDFKFGKDSLRYRILFDHALPSIFERIGSDENLKMFLLNPVYTDPDYYRELRRSQSWTYVTEYNKK